MSVLFRRGRTDDGEGGEEEETRKKCWRWMVLGKKKGEKRGL